MPAAPEIPLRKFATDSLPYVWNFASFLHPDDDPSLQGDIVLSATALTDPVSLTVSQPIIEAQGTAVRIFLSGGLPGLTYTVTITVQTAAGLTASSARKLLVTDDAR